METYKKRLLLARSIKLMVVMIVLAMFFVLLSGLFSSDDDETSLQVNVIDLKDQGYITTLWKGRPIIVAYRNAATIDALQQHNPSLRDATSSQSRQPSFARNAWRSRQQEIMVIVALGTDISCQIEPVLAEDGTLASFKDRCRGWRYDAAGRVYQDQGALRNLAVPEYSIENHTITLGDG